MSTFESLKAEVIIRVPTLPVCMPNQVTTALDTAKLWCTVVGAGLAVVALIMIGIGMFFQHKRGDAGEMLKSLGWWIGGVVLVSAAAGIAAVFIPSGNTNCVNTLNG
ncbi:TrbC/VirB2 family protein [Pseudarthrobacter sp. NPDC089323]